MLQEEITDWKIYDYNVNIVNMESGDIEIISNKVNWISNQDKVTVEK